MDLLTKKSKSLWRREMKQTQIASWLVNKSPEKSKKGMDKEKALLNYSAAQMKKINKRRAKNKAARKMKRSQKR
jgi:hypothetical protein